jgi:NADH-quinone oxidoreductase subunit G
MQINKYWICDEGRFNYRYVNDPKRITKPTFGSWAVAVEKFRNIISNRRIAVLIGTDLTNEEGKLIKDYFSQNYPGTELFSYGTNGIRTTKDDGNADKILKRKSKTSNLNGIESLGIRPFDLIPSGTEVVVVFRGGRASVPELKGVQALGIGVFMEKHQASFEVILPGLSFAEKSGTIINCDGIEQKFNRAINPVGQSKALSEIFMLLSYSKAGVA